MTATSIDVTGSRGAGRTGGRGWLAFVAVNLFVIFAGLSYIFFPMGTVVQDGNQTTGVLHVPREMWGSYAVGSALVLIGVAATGYRHGARWARFGVVYQFVFFLIVAAIEPDPVVPFVLGVILALVIWRGRRRFGPPAAGR